MADRADSTTASEVHDLAGSSPPGTTDAGFAPIGGNPPHHRPRPHPRRAATTEASSTGQPNEALQSRAKAFIDLIQRDRALWTAVPDVPDDDPRILECRASTQRVREASAALAEMDAQSPLDIGAKAQALLALLGERRNGWYEEIYDHLDLMASTLRDAVRLIGSRICTMHEAAAIDFAPWTGECPVPTNREWPSLGADHLPFVRMAWLLNARDKAGVMEFLASVDDMNEDAVKRFWEDIDHTRDFFRFLFDTCDVASLRIMIALSAMHESPLYAHRFKGDEAAA